METPVENIHPPKFKGIWLKAAIVFQILTSLVHSLSFINEPKPTNDTEKQMLDLMMNYHNDMGAGFTPTMFDIMNGLSAGFALLFMFGGLTNWYLWRSLTNKSTLKGIVLINTIIFGLMFVVNYFLTFLPPIVMSGLVFVFLLMAWITWPKATATAIPS